MDSQVHAALLQTVLAQLTERVLTSFTDFNPTWEFGDELKAPYIAENRFVVLPQYNDGSFLHESSVLWVMTHGTNAPILTVVNGYDVLSQFAITEIGSAIEFMLEV